MGPVRCVTRDLVYSKCSVERRFLPLTSCSQVARTRLPVMSLVLPWPQGQVLQVAAQDQRPSSPMTLCSGLQTRPPWPSQGSADAGSRAQDKGLLSRALTHVCSV